MSDLIWTPPKKKADVYLKSGEIIRYLDIESHWVSDGVIGIRTRDGEDIYGRDFWDKAEITEGKE